ncbi:pickpocket protein 28-like [Teleopsis dalmanni]|uniref:pickpocket protein 28-like n=1 Tax=Teleopsis dalmanni TaxID=139649 RepID=UPI0018CD1FBF|nr:pickpocket protein 28-like [Teleopsis dalmanni]
MLQMLCKHTNNINTSIANSITDWSNFEQFIINISQPCNYMLIACRYAAADVNCNDLFHPVVTDEGLCCVFNMVHPSFRYNTLSHLDMNVTNNDGYVPVDWNAEYGYPAKLPSRFYPRPIAGTGESLGLSLILDAESENYYCSSSNSIGFKILMHNPSESPNMREIGLLLGPGRETKVRLRAERTESMHTLRTMAMKSRQCSFANEVKLIVFSHYSQRNCEIECTSRIMYKHCGCISHFMPKMYGNESICSIFDLNCVESVRLGILNDRDMLDCSNQCWPSCYDVTYFPDFFSAPISHLGFKISSEKLNNYSSAYVERNMAVVNLYFKENSYRSILQTEYTGITDFLSSVGGIIGLFFGFSFISLAEFIFFAMIRPWKTLRNNNHVIEVKSAGGNEQNINESNRNYRNNFQESFSDYQHKFKKLYVIQSYKLQYVRNNVVEVPYVSSSMYQLSTRFLPSPVSDVSQPRHLFSSHAAFVFDSAFHNQLQQFIY